MGCGGSKPPAAGAKNAQKKGGKEAEKKPANSNEPRVVLGKYKLPGGREDIMGKGTSSICRKGVEIATGKQVAIKLYKEQQSGGKVKDTTMQKFKRQIEVLKELMQPFPPAKDPNLWSDVLTAIQPAQIFMQLIDYSQDPNTGEPGPDPNDGMLYVVTELAQYSLKDFLADRREKQKVLSKEAVRDLSKRMVLAMAGLHAKGLVHIDMKPENMMVFEGRLKVIDVDGCVRTGTKVSINDGSISFSPCYCAPEWARFMIKDNEQNIVATPGLDVWSVGMTLCELVTLDAIWKPQYANFMRNAHSHREAGFLFLEWLGDIKKPPLPRNVEKFDPGLLELLTKWFLVCDPKKRKSCAQTLSMPYLSEGGWQKYGEGKSKEKDENVPEMVQRRERKMVDDTEGTKILVKGAIFKLNSNGNPKDNSHWIKRDMWVAHNFSVCYYSQKDQKRLVLIDGEKLSSSDVQEVQGTVKDFAIKIESKATAEEKMDKVYLAFDSKEEMDQWVGNLNQQEDIVGQKFQLGEEMANEVEAFKLAVRNRRIKVEGDKGAFEPAFKSKLWKLKAQGDRTKEEHWFLRDMWIAKNGSMVYYSPKEERDLVYYTAADVSKAVSEAIQDEGSFQKNVFTVKLAPAEDGTEFEPGEFGCESTSLRDKWVEKMTAASCSLAT